MSLIFIGSMVTGLSARIVKLASLPGLPSFVRYAVHAGPHQEQRAAGCHGHVEVERVRDPRPLAVSHPHHVVGALARALARAGRQQDAESLIRQIEAAPLPVAGIWCAAVRLRIRRSGVRGAPWRSRVRAAEAQGKLERVMGIEPT